MTDVKESLTSHFRQGILDVMPPSPTFGEVARLHLALAGLASRISDYTRGMVPATSNRLGATGSRVEQAAEVLDDARELLALAVAYERRRGASWQEIGDRLGISRQAAHERYAASTKRIDDQLLRWPLDDDQLLRWKPDQEIHPPAVAWRTPAPATPETTDTGKPQPRPGAGGSSSEGAVH